MRSQKKIGKPALEESAPKHHDTTPPISAKREILIGKLRINITSTFAGEQTISDKLFIIANRKIKGICSWEYILKATLIIAGLLLTIRFMLFYF